MTQPTLHILKNNDSLNNQPISYIFHISDIHLRNNQRHTEYRQVFSRLYQLLQAERVKLEQQGASGLIVITGDLVHSKVQLPPLMIESRDFLANLAAIFPTLLIAGNHDLNLANLETPDTISGLLHRASIPNLYYLRESGIYRWLNCDFAVMSVFDYPLIPADSWSSGSDQLKIGLLHATLHGSQISSSQRVLTSDKYRPDQFVGYDAVLLGDIHLHQYFGPDRRIAYAGSLIQQDYGEGLGDHGYLKWCFQLTGTKSVTSQLISVPNDHGYLNLFLRGNQITPNYLNLPPKLSVKIQAQDSLSDLQVAQDYMNFLRTHHQLHQTLIIPYTPKIKRVCDGQSDDPIDLMTTNLNWETPAGQQLVIDDFLLARGLESIFGETPPVVTPNSTGQSKQIDWTLHQKDIREKLWGEHQRLSEELQKNVTQVGKEHIDCHWELVTLKFQNVYSYRGEHKLDVRGFEGIVGIFGRNFSGKSNLLDILLFALFDKASRGDRNDILSMGENHCRLELIFKVGDQNYQILRLGQKQKNGSVKIDAQFHRGQLVVDSSQKEQYIVPSDSGEGNRSPQAITFMAEENLTGQNRHATNAMISTYLGSYDDFVLTSIKLQSGLGSLIELKNSERKERLIQLLKLAIWDDYYTAGWAELRIIKKELADCDQEYNQLSPHVQKDLLTVDKQLLSQQDLRQGAQAKVTLHQGRLVKLNRKLQPVDEKWLAKKVQREQKKQIVRSSTGHGTVLSDSVGEKQSPPPRTDLTPVSWEEIQVADRKCQQLQEQRNQVQHRKKLIYFQHLTETEIETMLRQLDQELDKHQLDQLQIQQKEVIQRISKLNNDNQVIQQWQLLNSQKIQLEQWLRETEQKSAQLLSLEYDPDCHYCCQNVFVIDARACQAQMIKKKDELTTVHEKFQVVDEQQRTWLADQKQLQTARTNFSELEFKIRRMKDKMSVAKQKKQRLTQDLQAHQENQLLLTQLNKLKLELQEAQQEKNNLTEQKRVWDENRLIQEHHQRAADNQELLVKIKDSQQKLTYYQQGLQEVEDQILQLSLQQERLRLAWGRYQQLEKQRSSLIARQQRLEIYLKVVAKDGLPKYLLERSVPEFERMVNLIIQDLVDFRITMEVSDKKWNLYVVYPDKKLNVDLCSGYEKFIVSLATKIGLFHLSQMSKPQFLIIDEGFGSFDGQNLEKVSQIYQFLKSKYQFVLMITHVTSLQDEVDQVILVNREDRVIDSVTQKQSLLLFDRQRPTERGRIQPISRKTPSRKISIPRKKQSQRQEKIN